MEAKILRVNKTLSGSVHWELATRQCAIPGVDVSTARTLRAELGSDMRGSGEIQGERLDCCHKSRKVVRELAEKLL